MGPRDILAKHFLYWRLFAKYFCNLIKKKRANLGCKIKKLGGRKKKVHLWQKAGITPSQKKKTEK